MLLPLFTIEYILFHAKAYIMRGTGVGLSSNRAESIGHIIPDTRFYQDGIIGCAELLESSNIRNHLRNTHAHLFKLTEAESLSIRRANTHIGGIIEEVDFIVLEGHILARNNEAIAEHFHRNAPHLKFTLKELE
jgi:hypothetical protein